MENKAENIAAKKPVDSDFLQQRYKAWSPLLTPPCIIVLFVSVGVLCLAIGVAVLVASGLVKEYMSPPYSTPDHELNDISLYPFPGIHRRNLTIKIEEEMKAPIYFYYQLENVFQNHRRVVFSRSNTQLRGDGVGETAGCDPLEVFNDTELYPCGLLANMFFNDSYTLYVMENGTPQPLVTQKTGIAWESDRNKKFKRLTRSTVGPELYRLPDVDDEDFIVWMRAAGLPSFRKLKYIINSDLPAGTNLVIDIADTFRVTSFEGTKRVVLSTTTSLGGKNGFIGGLAIVLGVLHFLLSIFFGLKHKYGERPLGQLSHFGWPSASKQFLSALPKQVS